MVWYRTLTVKDIKSQHLNSAVPPSMSQVDGLTISVSCPVYRNVNHEDSPPLISALKGYLFRFFMFFFIVSDDVQLNKKPQKNKNKQNKTKTKTNKQTNKNT